MSTDGADLFLRLKKEYGVYCGAEIGPAVKSLRLAGGLDNGIVKGMIQARTVNIMVGDSGVGKSPLTYQLALAVATGTPFLGIPTQQARVLLVDYENALPDAYWMVRQIARHLGITKFPPHFQLWPYFAKLDRNAEDDPYRWSRTRSLDIQNGRRHTEEHAQDEEVERVIRQLAPYLVIFDSLRSHCPSMESDNSQAVRQIRRLRRIGAKNGTAFLFVHHVRKLRTRTLESLEHAPVLDWLTHAAGARALVNQTDTRLAVSSLPKAGDDDAALILRGNARTAKLGHTCGASGMRRVSLSVTNRPRPPALPNRPRCWNSFRRRSSFSRSSRLWGQTAWLRTAIYTS